MGLTYTASHERFAGSNMSGELAPVTDCIWVLVLAHIRGIDLAVGYLEFANKSSMYPSKDQSIERCQKLGMCTANYL